MKKILLSVLLLVSASSVVFAADIKLPSPVGYVNDFANVIDGASTARINSLARSLNVKKGAELAVITVKTTAPLDINTYAVKLFEKWKLGQKGKDNGLLIVAAIEDKKIKIETGYGLEGIITDGFSGRVLDESVIPSFKSGKYGEGLYLGASAISEKITKEYDPAAPVKKKKGISLYVILLAVLIMISGLLFSARYGEKVMRSVIAGFIGAILGFVFANIVGSIIGAIMGVIAANGEMKGGGFYGGGFGSFGDGGFGGGGGFGGFSGGGSGGGGAGRSW